jgi:hypothetical protein
LARFGSVLVGRLLSVVARFGLCDFSIALTPEASAMF